MSVEEWFGRKFERRGSIQLSQMPDNSASTIRSLSTEDVLELVRSEDTRSVRGLIAHREIRRRDEWTARVALVISGIALLMSIVGLTS